MLRSPRKIIWGRHFHGLAVETYIQACSWGYEGEITPTWGVASTLKAYVEKGGRGAAVNLTWTWTQKRQLQQALLDQQSSVEFTHVITITRSVMSQHPWLWGGPEDTEITIVKLLWLWTVVLDNVYIDFLRCGLVDMLFELKNQKMDD